MHLHQTVSIHERYFKSDLRSTIILWVERSCNLLESVKIQWGKYSTEGWLELRQSRCSLFILERLDQRLPKMRRRVLFRGGKGGSSTRIILWRMDYKLDTRSIQGRFNAPRTDLIAKNHRRIKSMTEPKFIPPLTYPETTKAMTPAFRAKKAMLSLISSFMWQSSLTDKRFRELKKGWNDKECDLDAGFQQNEGPLIVSDQNNESLMGFVKRARGVEPAIINSF